MTDGEIRRIARRGGGNRFERFGPVKRIGAFQFFELDQGALQFIVARKLDG